MSHLLNFQPAGKWGKEVLNITEEHCDDIYSLFSVDDSQMLSTDVVLGISQSSGIMKVLVARLANADQDAATNPFDDKLSIPFYSISHPTLSSLKLGQCYAFKWMDYKAECLEEEDMEALEDQTLGIYNHNGTVYVIYVDRHSNVNDDEEGSSKKSAAFEPLFFGDKDHELKDPRAATDLWISTLSLDRLKKTGQGKTGYERQLKDDTWKNCHSYKEVLDAASEEAGVDMYDEFLNFPEKFPTIKAMGDKAFIKRRVSQKSDNIKSRKVPKVA